MAEERPLSERPHARPMQNPEAPPEQVPDAPPEQIPDIVDEHQRRNRRVLTIVVLSVLALLLVPLLLPLFTPAKPTTSELFVERVRAGDPALWKTSTDAQILESGQAICTTIRNGRSPETAIMALLAETTKDPNGGPISKVIGISVSVLCPEFKEAALQVTGG